MGVAGEGRVHQCLRDSFEKLTDGCRKEELKLNIIQSRDVRLRPKLNKACSEEIAVYCKDVETGKHAAACTWSPLGFMIHNLELLHDYSACAQATIEQSLALRASHAISYHIREHHAPGCM